MHSDVSNSSPREKRLLLEELLRRKAREPRWVPLSFGQQLVFLEQMVFPNSVLYNIFVSYRIEGPLQTAALADSFKEIIARHGTLRTTFHVMSGSPVQKIAPQIESPFSMVDLNHLAGPEQDSELDRLIRDESILPFDLQQGPLIRIVLIRLNPECHVLLRSIHRIVADGWSLGIIARELAVLYEAFSHQRASPLPRLPVQYADFFFAQKKGSPEEEEQHFAHWQKQLQDAPDILDSIADRPLNRRRSNSSASFFFELPESLFNSLKTIGPRHGTSLFVVMLAAFKVLLYLRGGVEDILLSSPVANRNEREVQGLIGLFATLVPMRTSLSADPTFAEILNRVRNTALAAFTHQSLTVQQLMGALPELHQIRGRLLHVMFALQIMPLPSTSLAGLKVTLHRTGNATSNFGLILNVWKQQDKPVANFEYNTDLFEEQNIRAMAECYQRVLQRCAADPEETLAELSRAERTNCQP